MFIEVIATAYCLAGTTFLGTQTEFGDLAVDPTIIPLHSKVTIHGYAYRAQDTGAYIKGRRIDVFMHDCDEAERYGVRKLVVQVVSSK
jgi:3D (Asp-Asp-Asp) domain-containing protein